MTKNETYLAMNDALEGLIRDEPDGLANLSNSAALLFQSLEAINWAGFYLYKGNQLVLGPFQGKPACIRIALGKGVCGTAAQKREPLVVRDVHRFPGHIACDEASASEIVVPIVKNGKLMGVLDLDSPVPSRFDDTDKTGLQRYVDTLVAYMDWNGLADS